MKKPLQVLLVEDNPADAKLVLAELRASGFEPVWKRVETEADFLAELENSPDIILSDYAMPEFSGMLAAELLQASGREIPFILISGTVGEDVAVEAMRHGATDYLLKDRITRLGSAVHRALWEAQVKRERKTAEEALEQIRGRLILATASARIGIWDWDLVANKLVWDAQMYELYGIREEDRGGAYQAGQKGMHPDDQELANAAIAAAISGARDFDFEFRVVWPNGEVHHIEAHTVVQSADGTTATRMIGVNRDITERKAAEATLQLSEARSRSIIESAHDAFISFDRHGLIRDWNHQAEKIFGWSRPEAVGRFLHETIIPEQHREGHQLGMSHLQTTREEPVLNQRIELIAVRRSGEEFPVEMTIWDLEMGTETIYNAFLQDITERKRAQAELEDLHKQLVVASRQSGMAEIATNVIHSVGNVLNSVNVSAALVKDLVRRSKVSSLTQLVALLRGHAADMGEFMANDSKGKLVPSFLARLAGQLQNEQTAMVGELDSLTRNIVHIRKIVAMQQNYAAFGTVTEPLNVPDLVDDSLRLTEEALSLHRVAVIRAYENVPPLNAEKYKVLQVLVNLLRNAQQACQESAREDRQLTVRVAHGEGRLRISVEDNGVGIPTENLLRIFNHGFTTNKDGHGFGLHNAANAATEMGGSLAVHSDGQGRGATFTLELPL